MVTKSRERLLSLFVGSVFLAGLVASASLSFAQAPTPPGKGRDRPITRTLPRLEIYEKLGKEFDIPPKEAKAMVVSLEDRGFLLREAVMLVILANERAGKLVEEGKFAKNDKAKAMHASVEYLYEIVEKEGLGWITMAQRIGIDALRGGNIRALTAQANSFIGATSQSASVSRTPEPPEEAKAAPEEVKAALEGRKKALAEKKAKEGTRQADPKKEQTFPRETIFKNLQKELAVDGDTVESVMTRLEAQMPVRESVMLTLVANAMAQKLIKQGQFTKDQRKDALLSSVDYILPYVERGEGWGDLGKRVGVEGLNGVNLNKKANAIIGQK